MGMSPKLVYVLQFTESVSELQFRSLDEHSKTSRDGQVRWLGLVVGANILAHCQSLTKPSSHAIARWSLPQFSLGSPPVLLNTSAGKVSRTLTGTSSLVCLGSKPQINY
jgi:hypothetical protein